MSRHPAARQRQQRHVHAVLRHIDRHLDQPLDLVALAAVAHVSPFHFHRVFRAWTGENLGDYLSRRRLTLAACWLCNEPAASVLTLALRAGFASGEAFSRAFKARFGLSPSQWRGASAAKRQELRNLDQAAQVALRHDGSVFSDLEPDMHVTLCQHPAVTVAYLRHTGPYGQAIAEFWRLVLQRNLNQVNPVLKHTSITNLKVYTER
jgi:AraC family transcriptional regulator